jgi:hypothetical protein
MTPGGWINLVLSVGSVVVLFVWCVARVLSGRPPPPEHHLAHVEPVERDQADDR